MADHFTLGWVAARCAPEQSGTGDTCALPSPFWASVILNVAFGPVGSILGVAMVLGRTDDEGVAVPVPAAGLAVGATPASQADPLAGDQILLALVKP